MAIETTYKDMIKGYNPKYFKTVEEFETYYLAIHAEKGRHNYYTNKDGKVIEIPIVNHYPKLKEYEVWSEGYAATGESGTAILFGKTKARNFAQACHIVMCEVYLKRTKENNDIHNDANRGKYINASRWDYNPNELSYWACRLFWSKELASKSFG